jgi:IclR family transcriptional regulator, acetate operon repressor
MTKPPAIHPASEVQPSGTVSGQSTEQRHDRRPLAVDRVLGVIATVASNGGCNLTDLSNRLSVPKTSLLNLLPGLVEGGYLEKKDREYILGPASFSLAMIITQGRFDPIQVAEPLMQRLALDADKTVTLTVLAPNERMILHVAKAEPPDAMRFSVAVGTLSAVHTTAAGRIMLAYGKREWVEDYLKNAQLASQTARSIIDRDQLAASVEDVRRLGYSITRGETYDTVGALAAPVFDKSGLAFALVAAGAVEKVERQEEMLSTLVKRTAEQISVRLRAASGDNSP